MKSKNKSLIIKQLDKKIQGFQPLLNTQVPGQGWLNLIREALHMSLRQFGTRLQMTPQGIKDIERREKAGTITINSLKQAGDALGLQLVYGFIPKEDSLEKMIDRRAYEKAKQIVGRTSTTMKLEDQENSQARIKQAINELAEEIKREMPGNLWDQ
jgi:predicted DNA-binding mobile mystery protein A